MLELDPVERITVGAVGEPGDRTFYLQARGGDRVITLVVEKQQVQLLASSVVEMLARIGDEVASAGDRMDLESPIVPEWRAGRIAIGYEEDRDLILLEAEELVEGDEEAARARLWATKEQMLALARQGSAVVAAGRPECRFCGNPIDPEGHVCPATNGHGSVAGT